MAQFDGESSVHPYSVSGSVPVWALAYSRIHPIVRLHALKKYDLCGKMTREHQSEGNFLSTSAECYSERISINRLPALPTLSTAY